MSEPVLCYIHGQWAYFTTVPLAEQWGDDWDDAPHEHNAGEPYNRENITKVAFDGAVGFFEGKWSVEEVNRGDVPWLVYPDWVPRRGRYEDEVPAGATISEFGDFVRKHGGNVYVTEDAV